MEAYQWFLLGMMMAWTPGLLTLALLLRKNHIQQMPPHTNAPLERQSGPSPFQKLTSKFAGKPNQ
jgi:hypothetical protein